MLIDEIAAFLESHGFECSRQIRDGYDVICTHTANGNVEKTILPLDIRAVSPEEAIEASESASDAVIFIRSMDGFPLIIPEDRWRRQEAMTKQRLLAHLELFGTVYARNCEIRRIEKQEAQAFLAANHSYGYSACRYRYGMFLRRNTGALCPVNGIKPGTLVAVATFSNARRWTKGEKVISSYEWTRYASLPSLRISGGMGKMLRAFIDEVHPDDIMSYADMEWSEGDAYRSLGFRKEGYKDPVLFMIDNSWNRIPASRINSGKPEKPSDIIPREPGKSTDVIPSKPGKYTDVIPRESEKYTDVIPRGVEESKFYRNIGSRKFRLKLTDYE